MIFVTIMLSWLGLVYDHDCKWKLKINCINSLLEVSLSRRSSLFSFDLDILAFWYYVHLSKLILFPVYPRSRVFSLWSKFSLLGNKFNSMTVTLLLPVQFRPSPVYPGSQRHAKDLLVLLQYVWFASQLCSPVSHSFMSAKNNIDIFFVLTEGWHLFLLNLL